MITIILIGLSVTSCVNWTPVEYIATPIKEPPLTKVVLEQKAIDTLNSEFDCFLGSSADECADYVCKHSEECAELVIADGLLDPLCNMDLCT